MSKQLPQLAERLDETLGHADLRPDARAWGQALLDRLKAPVQIIVMGPHGAGKSCVINMLAGASVVPETVSAPVVEVVGGTREAVGFECMDGTTGVADSDSLPDGVVRLTRSLPLTTLEDCSFAEVDLDGPPAALDWALERADIILWCSPGFDDAERAVWSEIWSKVPEELKDHSFLVLTHADIHIARVTLTERLEALSDVVAEEFLSLFPIATPLAITAQQNALSTGTTAWKTSGGNALYDAVHKRIEHGRLADQDSARLFLSRFAGLRQTRAAMAGAPQARVEEREADDRLAEGRMAEDRKAGNRHEVAAPLASPVFDTAQDVLQGHADRMLAAAETGAGATAGIVLDQCVEAADALADLLNSGQSQALAGPGGNPLGDDAAECAEMMLLFQLERTEDAAADAVTLLMQLKREISEHAFG